VAGRDSKLVPIGSLGPEGYRLRIDGDIVHIESSTAAGRRHAAATLAQVRRLAPDDVVDIVDWPAIAVRGVMLDVSRDKVPTVDTLEALVVRLAGLKVNLLELYLEHTFAHPGHETVWRDASPYTADDIARLRRHATAHGIELVGLQAALGHLERWLQHPPYAALAAMPGGYRSPDGGHEPAACVDPARPGAFELVAEMVDNVARTFDAPRVHLGLDEPLDLSPGVWDAIFDVPGVEVPWAHVDNGAFCVPLPSDRRSQYVEWVQRLAALDALRDREVWMWADVMAPHPELMHELPEGMGLVEWGYEANHPFDARLGRIAAADRPRWVAPGTSSWSSLTGRSTNMLGNVRSAVDAAVRHGATGVLMCDWGNEGHFQYLPISWPGFVAAAAMSWNPTDRLDVGAAVDRWIALDGNAGGLPGLGTITVQLGAVADVIRPSPPEAGTFGALLSSPEAAGLLTTFGATAEMFAAADADLDRLDALLDAAAERAGAPDALLWRDELRTTIGWARLGLGWAGHHLGPGDDARAAHLVAEGARLVEEHRRLWLARNRPGGLEDSAAKLETALARHHHHHQSVRGGTT
jgi:hypothetical protein